LKYGDPLFGKPAHKFKPRKARVYNRYGLKAIHATRAHGLAQPGPHAKKHYRENILGLFGHRRFVLGISVLAIILAGVGLYADPHNPIFHSYSSQSCPQNMRIDALGEPCTDPTTNLWKRTTGQPNNFNDFNKAGNVNYRSNCNGLGAGQDCLTINATASTSAVAIVSSALPDISVALSKTLAFENSFILKYGGDIWPSGTGGSTGTNQWGFFITTNNTAPTHAIGASTPWLPADDPSVIMLMNIWCTASSCRVIGPPTATWQIAAYFLRFTANGDTIHNEDKAGCTSATSCYLTLQTQDLTICFTPPCNTDTGADIVNTVGINLNYTGSISNAACQVAGNIFLGAGCTALYGFRAGEATLCAGACGGNPTTAQTSIVPPNPFPSKNLYIGFFSTVANKEVDWEFEPGTTLAAGGLTGMQIAYFVPGPTTGYLPNIDTGGFFGPVIKALISIGVFILQNIISFSTFLYTLYIQALNILGGWIGLPNIGTNLDSFLRAFVDFMAQMAGIIANLGSGITVLINNVSFGATFIVGLLTTTASWLSAAVLLGGKLKQIFDLVFMYGNNMLWIFFWSTFFLYTATGEGWSGTLEFFNAVNWASSLGANFVIRMVNFGVQAIAFIKGFIPTEAGAPPPSSPVSEGGAPAGASLQSTAKPQPRLSRFQSGFSRGNVRRARGTVATRFKLSASRPTSPSFSAALEWDPIKVILLLGGLLLLMLWIGGGLSPFGAASATCTSTTALTAGNTARCFQTSYDILSQITAPILLMFASIGSITFLADKFGMIGSTFSGPATFRAVPRRHVRQRRELMRLRAREKQLRMEFKK